MSILSNKKEYVAEQIASGMPYDQITAEHGVTISAISKFKTRNKELVEKQANKYLDALPNIIDRDLNEIKEAQELSKNLINLLKSPTNELNKDELMSLLDEKKISYISKYLERIDKKETDIKRSVGILNSSTPAMVFQQMNIYNDNSQQISQIVQGIFQKNAIESMSLPEDVEIEAEIED